MTRIQPVDRSAADPKAARQLDQIEKALGMVPNMIATMAQSPAALSVYTGMSGALAAGRLGGPLHEQIALAVAGANSCDYCASAHTVLGGGQGVDADELARNLDGESNDARTAAALRFARAIVQNRGFTSDDDLETVRGAGFDDGEVVEIIAAVALNTFTNYFNHIARPEIDFPVVSAGEPAAA